MTKIHPSKTTELKGNEQVSGQKSKITVKGGSRIDNRRFGRNGLYQKK